MPLIQTPIASGARPLDASPIVSVWLLTGEKTTCETPLAAGIE